MLEILFWNGTARAETSDGVKFTATGSDCLWMHTIDVLPDDPSLPPVRGRIIDADTLASWVSTLTPR